MTPDGTLTLRSRVFHARTFVMLAAAAAALLSPPLTHAAAAQDRPGPAAELAVGWVGFADDGIVSEGILGGSGRWYLLPRVSVGPEVVYISGDNHSHLTATGNVTWDLFRASRTTPFLVIGAGVFRTRETFFSGTFTSTEGAFTAGGGVRAQVGGPMTAGVDVRVGWEPHIRISGFLGVRLGG